MELRRAEISDAQAIAAIENLNFTGAEAWSTASVKSFISNASSRCILALEGGRTAAYLALSICAPEAEIGSIACHPLYKNKGYASALMDYLFSLKNSEGIETVYLEVRKTNVPAIGLYRKFGFVPCGLRKNYYANPTEDAVVMKRDL